MKESKTNQNSSKRDSWTALQTELGLLSSPIEQEQVSVVCAVDQSENDAQNQESPAEVLENEAPPVRMDNETVAVNILMPETVELQSGGSHCSLKESDSFGFAPLDDCDIPKNAFASPRKSKAFRKTGEFAPTPADVPLQDASDKQDLALSPEAELDKSEVLFGRGTGSITDPFLSDELPTSLWQSRKSASVAKPPVPTASPSFSSDTLSQAEGKRSEWKQDIALSANDLDRPSSGKKRHERGNGRQQQDKSFDRRSREPMQDAPERDLREHPRNVPGHQKHRQPRAAAPLPSFDDFGMDGSAESIRGFTPADNAVDSSFDELTWEPKPTSKGRNREPRKPFRHADAPSFAERKTEPKGFCDDLEGAMRPATHRVHDDNDWLDDGVEIEQVSSRTKDNRQRKSFSEKSEKTDKRGKFDKDAKNAYEAERILARRATEGHGREERGESTSCPSVAPKRSETPAKATPTGTSAQKIAVSSWDDAVRDIIEKNMQRRPTTSGNKNDRDRRNNGGRGHRRQS